LITEHLLRLGHGEVGMINGNRANSVSAEREAGWLAAPLAAPLAHRMRTMRTVRTVRMVL
jgi:DNA-binding LacI/PurR family transcriptional regulator